MKVDITINDARCFPLLDRPIQRIYDSFDDLPEGPTMQIYAIEDIVVEKLRASSDRTRNEPRSLYDRAHPEVKHFCSRSLQWRSQQQKRGP